MRRVLANCAGAGALVLSLVGNVVASTDPVFGLWLLDGEKAIVEIGPCAEAVCGRIVWLNDQRSDATDDEAAVERRKALCGLELIKGFRQRESGAWDGGTIYNPRDGKQYSAEMRVRSDGTLGLRGYLLLPALGQTRIWTRAPDDRGGC